jgi:hypothetical protein
MSFTDPGAVAADQRSDQSYVKAKRGTEWRNLVFAIVVFLVLAGGMVFLGFVAR